MSFVVDSLVIPHTRASASVSQTCVHFRCAETRPAELEMVAARITSKDITQAGSVAKLVASLLDTLKTAPMDLREVAASPRWCPSCWQIQNWRASWAP